MNSSQAINLRNRINEIVSNGIKGVDLSAKLATEFLDLTNEEMLEFIFNMIQNGELVEVEYELPTMRYRTKSFILPRGTAININKAIMR